MKKVDIETYLKDKSNYDNSDSTIILLKLNNDFIGSLIFDYTSQSNNEKFKVLALQYSSEKDKFIIDANINRKKVQMNMKANLKFEQNESDLIMSFSGEDPTFGIDNEKIKKLEKFLPEKIGVGSVKLSQATQVTNLIDKTFNSDNITISMETNYDEVSKLFSEIKNFKDDNYIKINDSSNQNTDKLLADVNITKDYKMMPILYTYTSEGVLNIFNKIPLLNMFTDNNFIEVMNNSKDNKYKKYESEMENYAKQILKNASADIDIMSNIYSNGKIYRNLEDIDPFLPVDYSADVVGDYSKFSPVDMEFIYDADKKNVGISYLKNSSTYRIIYYDDENSHQDFSIEDYNKFFGDGIKTKGEINVPMPGEGESNKILNGIKTSINENKDTYYFVRYMRYDDKYADVVISTTENYQIVYEYILEKNLNNTWKVISSPKNSYDYVLLLSDPKYKDMNKLMMVPNRKYLEPIDIIRQELIKAICRRYNLIQKDDGSEYGITFFSTNNSYVYIITDAPAHNKYLINYKERDSDKRLEEIKSYNQLINNRDKDFPYFIGLQLN